MTTAVTPKDQTTVLTAIREVAESTIAPAAAVIDRERRFPAENLAALGAVGGLGLTIPVDHGGCGGGMSALAAACDAVGAACASTAMVFLMHCVASATLGAGGGDLAATALGRFAAGEGIASLAFSERGTGAHFYAPDIRVTRGRDGSLLVSGRKSFVTSAGHADYYVLLLAGEDEGSADLYVVDREQPGVRADGDWRGLGMAGNSSIALGLTDVHLGPAARVGSAGAGLELVFTAVAPFFLVGLAAVGVGIASAAAAAAIEHVKARVYADRTSLADVQYIQHLLADMDATVRAARLQVQDAARLGDSGDPGALVAIMEAKIVATESASEVTDMALLATGGQGYTPA
ncbi:MAG: acyl-CoA dehydrogenase family protein, partial [Trebonia sp.]